MNARYVRDHFDASTSPTKTVRAMSKLWKLSRTMQDIVDYEIGELQVSTATLYSSCSFFLCFSASLRVCVCVCVCVCGSGGMASFCVYLGVCTHISTVSRVIFDVFLRK